MTTELIAAVRRGPDAVVAELAGKPEAERRSAAPRLLKLFRSVTREWDMILGPDGELEPCKDWERRAVQHQALQLAVLGVATGSELRKLGPRALPFDSDGSSTGAYEVFADRRPDWVGDWADLALGDAMWWRSSAWELVRRLIRDGLMERPDSDAYVRGLMAGMWSHNEGVRERLEADPELLEWEVWRLFEVEGRDGVSLASIDGGQRHGWTTGARRARRRGPAGSRPPARRVARRARPRLLGPRGRVVLALPRGAEADRGGACGPRGRLPRPAGLAGAVDGLLRGQGAREDAAGSIRGR